MSLHTIRWTPLQVVVNCCSITQLEDDPTGLDPKIDVSYGSEAKILYLLREHLAVAKQHQLTRVSNSNPCDPSVIWYMVVEDFLASLSPSKKILFQLFLV